MIKVTWVFGEGMPTEVEVRLAPRDGGQRSTVKQPHQQRRDLLDSLGLDDDLVRTPPYWAGDSGADLMAAAADQGLEGVVAKRCAVRSCLRALVVCAPVAGR